MLEAIQPQFEKASRQQPVEPSLSQEINVHAVEPPVQGQGFGILKNQNTLIIINKAGDLDPVDVVPGIYVDDMQVISRLTLHLNGQELVALQEGAIISDNVESNIFLLNPAISSEDQSIPYGAIQVMRDTIVSDGAFLQKITFYNTGTEPVALAPVVYHDSRMVDMFTLRDPTKKNVALGAKGQPVVTSNAIQWPYKGVDGIERPAFVAYSITPAALGSHHATFKMDLEPDEKQSLYIHAGAGVPSTVPLPQQYDLTREFLRSQRAEFINSGTTFEFEGAGIQQWYKRSISDLAMLTNQEETGPYPVAGLPWFNTQFGRDAIETATQCLIARPDIARGVLRFLAKHQAQADDPAREAQIGKIPHELRRCESANAGIVPFGCYYGGVDTTLMFVMLADDYYKRTGDKALIEEIRPNIDAALDWARRQENAEGFFVYAPHEGKGLGNQFFKDSQDSVIHADGRVDVAFPRAVSIVQGYAYAAWQAGARFAEMDGDQERADIFRAKADALYHHFNDRFWMQDRNAYALAIDGEGELCRVVASENGELLGTGIVPESRLELIINQLTGQKFFSGFGVRTLMEGEGVPKEAEEWGRNAKGENVIIKAGYDPDSYHRGSVWPQLTSDIARNMAALGYYPEAVQLCLANQAIAEQKGGRLPEVLSGRSIEESPEVVDYPSSCSPQAWSAGAVMQDISTALGLQIDAAASTISFNPACVPEKWGAVKINNLSVNGGVVSLKVDRGQITVLEQNGPYIAVIDRRTDQLLNPYLQEQPHGPSGPTYIAEAVLAPA